MNHHLKIIYLTISMAMMLFSMGYSDTPAMCSVVQGLPGLNGRDGRDGTNGLKGDPGLRGEPGIPGERGSAGPPGKVGPKGNQGDKENDGVAGSKGEKGSTGATGLGLPGLQGNKGEKGSPDDIAKERLKVFESQLQILQANLTKYIKILLFHGAIQSGDKLFVTNGLKESFENDQRICKESGGSLAAQKNAAENSAVQKVLLSKGKSNKAFLGISDMQVEWTFLYLTGNKVTFTNWNPGEPNNNKDTEDCTEIQDNGKWNDIPCFLPRLVICELQ
ncbi:pulmonary surfactant-associated protein D-like isoform X2 [Pseudophryne corroboree]|uniref:pulmonary surfactant-associated protein D-like isoform X2 n=1 Tax=Pseudophryne corroboree TaxID=495146 RepID=UPI0030812E15